MPIITLGTDALGRFVELPVTDGNLIVLGRLVEPATRRKVKNFAVLELARTVNRPGTGAAPPLQKFEVLPG